ncbi:MAG: 2Fe-2S iron-sulfur cluster binding domain-containing protein [Deltaproteobacteria bacterium]|nr:2Fe-2S iron-sulfur cluster binding domain-containing protein [Deltaproteobacteria bacterium]
MPREIYKEFDGYDEIIREREVLRKYGLDFSPQKDAPEQYIARLHPRRLTLRVSDIIPETSSTGTLRLVRPEGALPPFLAGQYIALFLEIGGVRTARPYSISSGPHQTGYYDLTVRRVKNGLVSNYLLDEIKPGDLLESSGPEGRFYHNPLFHDRTMVCLAGGSGITPFMSMIREVVERGLDREIFLFYGNRTLQDAAFHNQLLYCNERFANFHYLPVAETPEREYPGLSGLITGELIKKSLKDVEDKTFYLCGPQAMYDFCIPELEGLGVAPRKIRREIYGPPAQVTQAPNWPVEIKTDQFFTVKVKSGPELEVPAGTPLGTSLERQGVTIPSLCRSGECSRCRVKILSGKVFEPPGTLVRRSDRRYGYTHACVAYPLSDLEIML